MDNSSSIDTNVLIENNIMKTDTTSFMAQVETFLTYKVASFINEYWFPILFPIGVIGNTLSFFVMVKPNNRKVSTCIYMAAISVNDNLMLGLALYNWLIMVIRIHGRHLWKCRIAAYLINFSLQSATFQVLAMTLDKYIAIKWPHRAAIHSTPSRARTISCVVIICTLCYNIPHLFASNLIGDQCLVYVDGGTLTKIYSWITFLVNGIIPFTMLIYMNFVIVKTVKNSRKMFTTSAVSKGTEKDIGQDKRQKTMKSAENQLTIMLLSVTICFLILLVPAYIRFIYLTFVQRDTPSKYASSMLFFQITYKLYTTNSGFNFFLYCISGKKFRDDLKDLFCLLGKPSGSTAETTKSSKSEQQPDMTDLKI